MDNEKREEITFEELSLSNMWQIESVTRLLVKKGIFSTKELNEEYKLLKKEYDKENKK